MRLEMERVSGGRSVHTENEEDKSQRGHGSVTHCLIPGKSKAVSFSSRGLSKYLELMTYRVWKNPKEF